MFFQNQLPVNGKKNKIFQFKMLPLASAILAMFFINDCIAASIVSSSVKEYSDQTELLIEFSEPVKIPVRGFRINNPDRKVLDFSHIENHDKFSPRFESGSRVKAAQIFSSHGRSRLLLELSGNYDVVQNTEGNFLRLMVKGPKSFDSKSVTNMVSGTQFSGVEFNNIKGESSIGLLLKNLEIQEDLDSEIVKLQFDSPDVQVDTIVKDQELRLRIPMARMQQDLTLPLENSGMRFFSGLKIQPIENVLSVSLNLKNSKYYLRQKGSIVELVLMGKPILADSKKNELPLPIFESNPPKVFLTKSFAGSSQNDSINSLRPPEAIPVASRIFISEAADNVGQFEVLSDIAVPVKNYKDTVVSSRPQAKFGQDVLSNSARYIGKPISLDFKDTDIRTVMQVFAEFTKMNLVVSDSVQGKISVHLKDVPWDQALEIVMRSKGLVSSQSGNVLLVSSAGDGASEQIESAKRRAQDDMEPLVSRTLIVSYQKTEDLLSILKSKDSKLMSSRGTIIADERTSQVFIEDTPSRIERIVSIVQSMDKPVKQVMIEARVVLADTSVSRDLGVRMRGASNRSAAFSSIADQFGSKGFVDTGVDSSTALAYTLFNSRSTRLITMQLRALETENKIKTVSNPRVITSNKEPAVIEQGTEIPYQIATSSGATAIEFKEANLKLEVTPQIAPDGTVLLDVNVSKDSVGISTSNGPAIDTRRVKTKVLVSDGGTVVLGGIFEESDNVTRDKTPFLGDVPVVGHLFKSKSQDTRKSELLIFLTPVVLKES